MKLIFISVKLLWNNVCMVKSYIQKKIDLMRTWSYHLNKNNNLFTNPTWWELKIRTLTDAIVSLIIIIIIIMGCSITRVIKLIAFTLWSLETWRLWWRVKWVLYLSFFPLSFIPSFHWHCTIFIFFNVKVMLLLSLFVQMIPLKF